MKSCLRPLNPPLLAMKILRCRFFEKTFWITICFGVVFATTSAGVSVIYWYACIFTGGLKKNSCFLFTW